MQNVYYTPIIIFELNPYLPSLTLCNIQDTRGSIITERSPIVVVCPGKTRAMNLLYGVAKSMRLSLNKKYLYDSLKNGGINEACLD